MTSSSTAVGQIGWPPYGWRIWAGWIGLTAVLLVPLGALVGYVLGDGSRNAILAGVWIVGVFGSVAFFEKVNQRLRRSAGLSLDDNAAVGLAATGLFLGIVLILFAGPLAILLSVLAWRRLRRFGSPIATGVAATVGAFLVGCFDCIYAVLVLTDVLP